MNYYFFGSEQDTRVRTKQNFLLTHSNKRARNFLIKFPSQTAPHPVPASRPFLDLQFLPKRRVQKGFDNSVEILATCLNSYTPQRALLAILFVPKKIQPSPSTAAHTCDKGNKERRVHDFPTFSTRVLTDKLMTEEIVFIGKVIFLPRRWEDSRLIFILVSI